MADSARDLMEFEQHGCVEVDENGGERYFDFPTAVAFLNEGKSVTNSGCISDCFCLRGGLLCGRDGKTRSFPVNAFILEWELVNA